MNFLDDKCKKTNCLDEKFVKLKCMDETISKKIMFGENHMYMDDNYKKHEIFE
jgi:hypothetical protein